MATRINQRQANEARARNGSIHSATRAKAGSDAAQAFCGNAPVRSSIQFRRRQGRDLQVNGCQCVVAIIREPSSR